MIVLDTDVLSIVQRRGGPDYDKLLRRLDVVMDEIVVSIISFEEQMRGWLAFIANARSIIEQPRAYGKLLALVDDFSSRPILDFDLPCAVEFESLLRQKIRIGTMDLKIAATAIANNALLISRNLVDFRKVPGLKVEDWTA